ncbi:MAG: HAMP domain-containing histidine kinase [Flavobacteriales bacterium]|nr:HAMP domain-containing histidine kinase [Flavobacteriales bacterium]
MNLYHKKQRWKLTLLLLATLLVTASLWFSFQIVQKVQDKEVDRIQQWAESVRRKSELVKLTDHTFQELSQALENIKEKDSIKVETWTLAMAEVGKDLTDYSFAVSILQNSSGIPAIITDEGENFVSAYNLEGFDANLMESIKLANENQSQEWYDSIFRMQRNDSIRYFITNWRDNQPPIDLVLYGDERQKVFYFDSVYFKTQKLKALEQSRDSLFEGFNNELINNEYLVPVMFIDKENREVLGTNMKEYEEGNGQELLEKLYANNDSIVIELGADRNGVIYYEHSAELIQMKYFPFVQFFIIGLFVLIAYLGFSTFRKAEQDQVWVGMAKETAHQLGTPISSLMAWNQLLEAQGTDSTITTEINTDIERLTKVTNRFSKIGSDAILEEANVREVLQTAIDYLRKRISNKIIINFHHEEEEILAPINVSLLEWVIENISKNAVDAMEDGKGQIDLTIFRKEDDVIIDITDNGKGIPSNKIKTVFQPGYTTKKRGWGLGLSLVKRIVEDFHKGKVFVQKSELNVGTTFRIILKA